VTDPKPILLVVEDDLDVADMLNAYFRVQGYDVTTANWGEDAIQACNKVVPDIVILDIRLPDIDGYEVARQLRSNRRTKEVPIIFLTEKRGRNDRLQGLQYGADDYITKPFDIQELRLRVRNALRRSSQGSLTNPVTNLPEGTLVDEKLTECLDRKGWAILLISLVNLDSFRENYGFVASDDVLRAVSLMIHNAIRDQGSPNDFLGQLTPTDFILFTSPNALPELNERIRLRLEQALDYFYPIKDRERSLAEGRLEISIKQFFPQDKAAKNLAQFKKVLLK
jgi:PleD family two-component response regulator